MYNTHDRKSPPGSIKSIPYHLISPTGHGVASEKDVIDPRDLADHLAAIQRLGGMPQPKKHLVHYRRSNDYGKTEAELQREVTAALDRYFADKRKRERAKYN